MTRDSLSVFINVLNRVTGANRGQNQTIKEVFFMVNSRVLPGDPGGSAAPAAEPHSYWLRSRLLSPDGNDAGAGAGNPPPKDAGAAGDPPPKKDAAAGAGDPPPDDKKGLVPVAELAEERKKRQATEAKVKDLETKFDTFKDSIATALGIKKEDDPKAALDKATGEVGKYKQAAERERARSAVISAATKKGAVDPEAVFALGNVTDLKVDLETGKVEGADELVDAVLKERPYLLGGKPGPTPAGGKPANSDPNPSAIELKEIEEMEKKAMAGDQEAIRWVQKNLKKISAARAKK